MYGNCLTIYEQASPELQARVEERVEVWEREQAAKAMLLSTHNQKRCNVTGAGAASPGAVSPTPGSPVPPQAVGASEGQASPGATPQGGAEAKEGAAGEEGKEKEGAGSATGGAAEASGGATRPPKPPRPSSAHVDASATTTPGPSPSSPAATQDPASVASSAGAAEGQAPPASEAAEAPTPTSPVVEPVSPPAVTSPPEPEPLQPIFAPKCLCLLSKWPFISASRAWLKQVRGPHKLIHRHLLAHVNPGDASPLPGFRILSRRVCLCPRQLYRLSLSPNPLPLERYICNFLQEVPCPVPGKIEVQYSMVDQVRVTPPFI